MDSLAPVHDKAALRCYVVETGLFQCYQAPGRGGVAPAGQHGSPGYYLLISCFSVRTEAVFWQMPDALKGFESAV